MSEIPSAVRSAVQAFREMILAKRTDLFHPGYLDRDTRQYIYFRDHGADVLNLWDTWRATLPHYAPPPEPFICSIHDDGERAVEQSHRALDALQLRLEQLFGPEADPKPKGGSPSWISPGPDGNGGAAAPAVQAAVGPANGNGGAAMPADQTAEGTQTGAAPAVLAWTPADGPMQWAKLFAVSSATFKKRCGEGKIRHKKLSSKSYQVAIDDLPAMHRDKFRAAK